MILNAFLSSTFKFLPYLYRTPFDAILSALTVAGLLTLKLPWSEVKIISEFQFENSLKQSFNQEFSNQLYIAFLYADSFGINSFKTSDSEREWPNISTKLTTIDRTFIFL